MVPEPALLIYSVDAEGLHRCMRLGGGALADAWVVQVCHRRTQHGRSGLKEQQGVHSFRFVIQVIQAFCLRGKQKDRAGFSKVTHNI